MAASTVWSIQMKIASGSTAPKMFQELRDKAKQAATQIEAAEKALTGFDKAAIAGAETIEKAFGRVDTKVANTKRIMGTLSRTMRSAADAGANGFTSASMRIQRGFGEVNRSAGNMARTFRVVSRASSAEFGMVSSSLNAVRVDANLTAAAVRGIGSAARSIPRNIRVSTGVGGGSGASSGGSGMGTMALAAGGLAAGGVLMGGIAGAGTLQGATLQAAIATGRMGGNLAQSTANMADFRDIAFNMSNMTGQNISESMGVIASMASAGVSPAQLKQIYKPIAQFTDILHFGKDKMDYGEAAGLGAGLVHDMRLMNPADTAYGLGRIGQLAYLSPHGTNQLATQVRRMAPMLENVLPGTVQNRADQITLLAAWADRMGNLPFAGSAIGQMTTQMIAPRSKRVLNSLETLGVYDTHGNNRFFNQKTGTFDVMGALLQVQNHMDTARASGKAGPAIQALFGGTQNMQRIMMALTSKESRSSYNALKKQMTDMGTDPVAWMNKVQTQLMQQLSTTTQRLTSNFQTLQAVIGDKLLPSLTPFVSKLADITATMAQFLNTHPRAAQAAGIGLGALGAAGVAASLAVGGYVAGSVLHRIPGVGRLMVGLGHHFRGVGMGSMEEGGARGVLGMGRGLLDFANLSHLRGFMGGAAKYSSGGRGFISQGITALSHPSVMRDMGIGLRGIPGVRAIGSVLERIGGGAKFAAGALNVLVRLFGFGAANLLRLGARAIPVVGDILLLIDAVKFLGSHSHDIGKGIGMAAKWIVAHGIPMLLDAFKSLITGIFGYIMGIFKSGPSGLMGSIKSGWQGLLDGWNYDKPKPKSNVVPLHPAHAKSMAHAATGGYTRGEGLTYLHKNELVVNDKLTRKLERMTSHEGRGTGGTITHRIVLASEGGSIPQDPRDLRRLARAIADELGYDVSLDSRSGGATPQMFGHSLYGITQGIPA